MTGIFIPAIILAVLGMILQGIFIAVDHEGKYVPAAILKGLAALVFVVIGFLAGGNLFICLGLTFGMMGDVLLGCRHNFEGRVRKMFQMSGSFIFFVGHIMYIAAEVPMSVNMKISIPAGAVVAVILLYIIYSTVEFGMLYKVFGVLYIEVVTIMTAIALGNLFAKGTLFWTMFAVGAVLFTASDVMMVLNARIRNGFLRFMNLSLYYVGQLLIALSLYFIE